MQIHLVPLLLGDGTRLFDNLDAQRVKLEPIQTIEGPDVTHLTYRFIK
jgi:hypothetical protein